MCGNVWEWCQDEWHGNYINAPTDGSAWLAGTNNLLNLAFNKALNIRLLRGGSWLNYPAYCRSAYRTYFNLDSYSNIGFRVVCSGAART
jgi:formylglycine-generating enzyme required for sulfatase activity